MSETVKVRYVGLKDTELDHLYGTGIRWVGKGDIQTVPLSAWLKMEKHTDVWELADEEPVKASLAADVAPCVKPSEDLSDMNAAQLRAWAESSGKKIDGRLKSADAIRAQLAA